METFETEALRIDSADRADRAAVEVVWSGKSNGRHPSKVLDPFLAKLVQHAASGGRGIEMHFETLEYFNSSTVSSLIRFVRLVKENAVELRMTYDEGKNWQKLSFEALRVFADGERLRIESNLHRAAA